MFTPAEAADVDPVDGPFKGRVPHAKSTQISSAPANAPQLMTIARNQKSSFMHETVVGEHDSANARPRRAEERLSYQVNYGV